MRLGRVSGSDNTVLDSKSAMRCSRVLIRSINACISAAVPAPARGAASAPGISSGCNVTAMVCGWLDTVTSCDERSNPLKSTCNTYWPGDT